MKNKEPLPIGSMVYYIDGDYIRVGRCIKYLRNTRFYVLDAIGIAIKHVHFDDGFESVSDARKYLLKRKLKHGF